MLYTNTSTRYLSVRSSMYIDRHTRTLTNTHLGWSARRCASKTDIRSQGLALHSGHEGGG